MFIGVSAGGSLALNVLSLADKDLKKKISGVIAAFPITDYEYTLSNTKRKNILEQLNEHFLKLNNPKETMRLSSPIACIEQIPSNAKIFLIEATNDTHVPPKQIENYYYKLRKLNRDAVLIKYNTDHLPQEREFGELVKDFLR